MFPHMTFLEKYLPRADSRRRCCLQQTQMNSGGYQNNLMSQLYWWLCNCIHLSTFTKCECPIGPLKANFNSSINTGNCQKFFFFSLCLLAVGESSNESIVSKHNFLRLQNAALQIICTHLRM